MLGRSEAFSTRVIRDIRSLGQAIKIVKDVELTYEATIERNISYLWAVDEDIVGNISN
jgi:hypothetical protein